MSTTIIKRKRPVVAPVVALKMEHHNMPYKFTNELVKYYANSSTEGNSVLFDELNILLADENINLILRIYQENKAFEDLDHYPDIRQNVEYIFNVLLILGKYNNYTEFEKELIYEKYRTSEEVKYIINKKMRELCKDYDINPNKIIVFII